MSAAPAVTRMPEAWKNWEGQVVNEEFPLRQFLGSSDHSAVFLTEYGPQRRKAAIKFIPANPQAAEQQLARWERARKLSHPTLLHVLKAGRCRLGDAALLYVVMEHAEEDLAQIVPQRALTPDEVRALLAPVLDCLGSLHGQGLVHGRLKPANVMAIGDQVRLSSDGIVPFGESKGRAAEWSVYDAPEAGAAMPPSDVWSLGVTLVEVLTQHPPVWREGQQGDLIVPETLPSPFLEIVRNSLRRDPGRRWSVAEIVSRLKSTEKKQPAVMPGRKAATGSRRWVIPVAGILAIALLWGGWRLLHRSEGAPGTEPAAVAQQEKMPQLPATPVVNAKPAPSGKAKVPAKAAERKPAPASSAGAVAKEVEPQASRSALATITGKVRVRVKVTANAAGDVTDAKMDSAGPSQYFARKAMEAARGWKFTGPGEWVISFYFTRGGTEAKAEAVR